MDLSEARAYPLGTDFYVRVRTLGPVDKEGFVSCAIDSNLGLLPRTYSYKSFECTAPDKPRPLESGDPIVFAGPESSGQIGQLIKVYGADAVVLFDRKYGWAPVADYRRARIADVLSAGRKEPAQ